MIQSIMLAALGFVAASLIALLLAPAYWARAVRLTTQRLRQSLPLSEQEIRASRDLMRAEFAIKVHQLERGVEQERLAAHRKQIDINRRDIDLRRLGQRLEHAERTIDEQGNARSVFEQTIKERVPTLEQALAEAQASLRKRESTIAELRAAAARQAAALDEGRAILTQRALEVQNLQTLLQEASARQRSETGSDALALRSEIESLKARLAERDALIERRRGETPEAFAAPMTETKSPAANDALPPENRELAARYLQDLETQIREQSAEIERLRAENEATLNVDDPIANARVRESRVWLKARLDRLHGDLEREQATAGRLRTELAATNDRLARQGQELRDALKREGNRAATTMAEDLASDPPAASPEAPAATTGEPRLVSERARELQRALQGPPAQPQQTEAAPSANETDADAGTRARLLDRLKTYEQAS